MMGVNYIEFAVGLTAALFFFCRDLVGSVEISVDNGSLIVVCVPVLDQHLCAFMEWPS